MIIGKLVSFNCSVKTQQNSCLTLFITILGLILFQSIPCLAQDTLVLRDGKKLPVKVIEVKKYIIQYKKVTNLNGPTYEYDIRDIGRIKYESGAIDEFNPVKGEAATTESMVFGEIPKVNSMTLGRNVVYLNVVELAVQNISFSYERIVGRAGKVGLRIPVSFNLSGAGNISNLINNYFYTGIDLNFYPFGQGQSRFIIGPSLRFGSTRLENSVYSPQNGGYVYSNSAVSYTSFLIQGGFVWCPVKELSFLMTGGLGTRYYIANAGTIDRPARGTVNLTFCVGYRF
jgi:hypothetical protein